jgi:polysaccharide export outer membrane protein
MQRTNHFTSSGAWPGRLVLLALPALCVLLLAGCVSPHGQFSAVPGLDPVPLTCATNSLTEGDLVSITFQYSTNFNAAQKIALDGTLNLETVGQVKAAGKTSLQLQEELAKLYKPQIKDDVVTVKVLVPASSIYISGAVVRPGKVPFDRPMTVLEGVMEAGGFDPNRAKLAAVTVLRLENGRQRTYHIDLGKVLQGADEDPFYLMPFDIIHVPLKTFNF